MSLLSPNSSEINILQPNELHRPTIKDTALYRVPIWAYTHVAGRFLKKSSSDEEDSDIEGEDTPPSSTSGADDFEVLEKVKTSSQNGSGKVVKRKKSGRR